jgi:hypothetical protein
MAIEWDRSHTSLATIGLVETDGCAAMETTGIGAGVRATQRLSLLLRNFAGWFDGAISAKLYKGRIDVTRI